jgi:hypothetical protein
MMSLLSLSVKPTSKLKGIRIADCFERVILPLEKIARHLLPAHDSRHQRALLADVAGVERVPENAVCVNKRQSGLRRSNANGARCWFVRPWRGWLLALRQAE